MLTADGIREAMKHYAELITIHGGTYEYHDYGAGMSARKNKRAIWVCQVFLPERDGAIGGYLICEDNLIAWLKGQDLEEEV